ncbi:MAG: class I SAM-dependent methyltransferase [Minisyncoccia bacterium]
MPPRTGNGGFMDPQRIAALFGIREGMRIADFGCGSGFFPIYMAKLAGKDGVVTAVDVLETALDTVRAKAKTEGLSNIAIVRANLEVFRTSGLGDNSQDLALLANVLYESKKKEEIIKEANRVLKTGGGLVVIDWKKSARGFGPPENARMDQDSTNDLVEKSGFKFVNEIDAGAFHFGMRFRKI